MKIGLVCPYNLFKGGGVQEWLWKGAADGAPTATIDVVVDTGALTGVESSSRLSARSSIVAAPRGPFPSRRRETYRAARMSVDLTVGPSYGEAMST